MFFSLSGVDLISHFFPLFKSDVKRDKICTNSDLFDSINKYLYVQHGFKDFYERIDNIFQTGFEFLN